MYISSFFLKVKGCIRTVRHGACKYTDKNFWNVVKGLNVLKNVMHVLKWIQKRSESDELCIKNALKVMNYVEKMLWKWWIMLKKKTF